MSQLHLTTVMAPYEMWSRDGTRRGGDDGSGWRMRLCPRVPTQDTDGKRNKRHQRMPPMLCSIPKYTESVCSSFWGGVSKCFCQVKVYFLLALATWKHEGAILPLALDPTEVAHHWA